MSGRGYRVCPECGAALDPGEQCDCQETPYEGKPHRRVDKHLEACRRRGYYIQPGFKVSKR